MTKRAAWFLVAFGAAGVGALVIAFGMERTSERITATPGEPAAPKRDTRAAEMRQALEPSPEATVAPAGATSSARDAQAALPDEASLMSKLRSLTADPTASLELAREGNRRFPGSDDAPERSHIVVKSLASLGRFEEARAEAATMVETYRDTPWANNVERHLLTNPLTHSSERGHGKARE